MKNSIVKLVATVAMVVSMLVMVSGCSTVNTSPDAVALHYSGGAFQSQAFVECVERNKVAQTKYSSMTECKQAGLSESTCLALRALEEGDVPFYTLPEDQSVQVTGG